MSMSSLPSPTRALHGLLCALLVTSLAGCYDPTIGPKLRCNPNYDPTAGQCPMGYHCGGTYCVKGPLTGDGGGDGGVDKPAPHPDGPVDMVEAPMPDVQPDVPCVNVPIAGCAADTSKGCDPVCQSGCSTCGQKCSSNTNGAPTCNVPLPTRPKGLGEACAIASASSSAQTDDCAPGLVCVMDTCASRCYKFCKSDMDCGASTCTRDAGGGVKICDVQPVTCNPIRTNGMPTGCPGDAQGCYLSGTVKDRTFCDCEFKAGGTNAPCSVSRDCFPGLVCVDVGGTGSSFCRPVCGLAVGASDCVGGTTCVALNKSTMFGYCN
jgi:hypothetical protein